VAAGAGNLRLFESLGARVVEGGQSMNPPASALVAAVEASPADEVILLPNNPNLVLAAEQAAGLVDKTAVVLPTDSIPAGLAAVVVFDPDRPADDNADAMRETLQGFATGAVTIASRDTRLNGRAISEGSYLGLFGGDAVAGGPDFDEVARAVIERLLAEPRDVLTFLTGAEEPSLDRLLEELRERHPDLELEVHDGGQPHYPLLLGAE
jgi:dihydroxyacetone kinase-like predicted kinase